MIKYKRGIVVFSGGQDSTTCLGVALKECQDVTCIAFDYGQRHAVELECARSICNNRGIDLRVVKLDALKDLGITSALLQEGDIAASHVANSELPASFVPARNAMFLTLSHALAQELEADAIYTGVCQTDYSGYPDCRQEFITQLGRALNTGYEQKISILTPLMNLTKAETFELAHDVGFLDVVLDESHTCYEGDHATENEWGYGCGECPSCLLRKKGYEEFNSNSSEKYVSGN